MQFYKYLLFYLRTEQTFNIILISIMQQQPTNTAMLNKQGQSTLKDKGGTQLVLKKEIKGLIIQLISKERWNLSCQRLNEEQIEYILSNTRDYHKNIQMLWLHWNQINNLIPLIIKFDFVGMKIINVGGNNIQSIQNLQLKQFKCLQQLWLWNNKIVKIDCLRKCQFPMLKFLDVSQNLILQCSKLYEVKAPLLQRINIENNCFSTLNHFAKQFRAASSPIKILFMQNQIIKAFSLPLRKGKKQINQITFNSKLKPLLKCN